MRKTVATWYDAHTQRPAFPGRYLTCTPNPTHAEPFVEVNTWYKAGDVIWLDVFGVEELVEQLVEDQHSFTVPNAGFWATDGEKCWILSAVTHWSVLPNLPDGYSRGEGDLS